MGYALFSVYQGEIRNHVVTVRWTVTAASSKTGRYNYFCKAKCSRISPSAPEEAHIPNGICAFFCVSGRDSKSCRHSPVDCDCGQFKNWPLQLFLQSKMQPNLSFRAKEAHIPAGICAFFCVSGRDSKSCKRISPFAPMLDFPPLIRYLIIKFPMNLRDIDVF